MKKIFKSNKTIDKIENFGFTLAIITLGYIYVAAISILY